MSEIIWPESNFVSLKNGIKTMVITNWRNQDKWKNDDGTTKMGLTMDVISEDDKECKKEWTTTSIRAISELRPILEPISNTEQVKISVIKTGEKKNTNFSIKRIE